MKLFYQSIRHIDLETKISSFSEYIEHQTCQRAAPKKAALHRQNEFRMVIVSAAQYFVFILEFKRLNSLQIMLDILVR